MNCEVLVNSIKLHRKYYKNDTSAFFLPENDMAIFAAEWKNSPPEWHDININYA